MEVEVVGCYGSKFKDKYVSSYLIKNGEKYFSIDAGSICNLPDDKQMVVTDSFITHSHSDHWEDLRNLSYNLGMPGNEKYGFPSVEVHGSKETIESIVLEGFEGKTWVPFHKILINGRNTIKFNEFKNPFELGNFTIKSFPVKHNEGSVGYMVSDPNSSVLFLGDMGPMDKSFWEQFRDNEKLKNVIIECSYPDRLSDSHSIPFNHLSPKLVEEQIGFLGRSDVTFYATHIFPRYEREVLNELSDLFMKKVPIKNLIQGGKYNF